VFPDLDGSSTFILGLYERICDFFTAIERRDEDEESAAGD